MSRLHSSLADYQALRLDNRLDISVSVASNTPASASRYHQMVWRRSVSSRVGESAETAPVAAVPPALARTDAFSSSGSMRARFASAGSKFTATRCPIPRAAPSGRISYKPCSCSGISPSLDDGTRVLAPDGASTTSAPAPDFRDRIPPLVNSPWRDRSKTSPAVNQGRAPLYRPAYFAT